MFVARTLTEIYQSARRENKKVFSIEVIPPLEAHELSKATSSLRKLAEINPSYISVTRRAEGSDEYTLKLCEIIQEELSITAVPHITAVHQTKQSVQHLLSKLQKANIKNILLIRGDTPLEQYQVPDCFNDVPALMACIKDHLSEFCISVAAIPEGYPHDATAEKESRSDRALLEKQMNGASFALTQLFLRSEVWNSFITRCRDVGVSIPVIPGMMPVTSQKRLLRMAEITGLSIPENLKTIQNASPEEFRFAGLRMTEELVLELLKTAPGIHFFSFNSARDVTELKERLSHSVRWL